MNPGFQFRMVFALLIIVFAFQTLPEVQAYPRNLILLIGDGMGFEQVKAAGMYLNGASGTLPFESLPFQGEVTVHAANSSIPDSAAAGTSIATGVKVNNDVVSVAIPGDGSDLYTILEYYRDISKRTGLVTTTYTTHATPASFGAHQPSRNNFSQIANDYLTKSRPNVLLGGGANGMSVSAAEAAGYVTVTNRTQMNAVNRDTVEYLCGLFGTYYMPYEYDFAMGTDSGYNTLPHLREMVEVALDVLDRDPNGFFLMIEGGRIDHAGHDNRLDRNIFETIEFARTFDIVMEWMGSRRDTLVIVTADHETGGLTVLQNNGQGNFPTVSWSSGNHTGLKVPVYATGPNSEMIGGTMDNTDFFAIMTTPWEAGVHGYQLMR